MQGKLSIMFYSIVQINFENNQAQKRINKMTTTEQRSRTMLFHKEYAMLWCNFRPGWKQSSEK